MPSPSTLRTSALLSALAFATGVASAQLRPEVLADLRETVGDFAEAQNAPSVQVAIRRHGRLVFSHAVGHANLEWRTPARRDTVYEIGSVTKQFTAALCLMMEAEGKLKLDDPLGAHLADLPEAWRPITLRQALSHTAGLKDYLAGLFNQRRDYAPKELIELIGSQPLDFEPGSAWAYSNTGYFLAGMVLEKVSGQKFATLLEERIARPLEMARTRMVPVSELVPNRAGGYTVLPKSTLNSELLRMSAAFAAGAILSTAEDQTRWLEALRTGRILSPAQRDALWSRAAVAEGRTADYGLGFAIHDSFGERWFEHGGNTYGFSSGNLVFPDSGLVVSVQVNRAGTSVTGLGYRLAQTIDPRLVRTEARPLAVDPEPETTRRLRDAVDRLSRNQSAPDDLAPEMVAFSKTVRGRMANSAGRAATGRLLRLRPVAREERGGVVRRLYEATYEKVRIGLRIETTPDGRISSLGSAPLSLPSAFAQKTTSPGPR